MTIFLGSIQAVPVIFVVFNSPPWFLCSVHSEQYPFCCCCNCTGKQPRGFFNMVLIVRGLLSSFSKYMDQVGGWEGAWDTCSFPQGFSWLITDKENKSALVWFRVKWYGIGGEEQEENDTTCTNRPQDRWSWPCWTELAETGEGGRTCSSQSVPDHL